MPSAPKGALRGRDGRRCRVRGKRPAGFVPAVWLASSPTSAPRLAAWPCDHPYLRVHICRRQGQGELHGPGASLFFKCRYSMGSRRCSMDQHFLHLPWFFPEGRAVVYICVNTWTYAYMVQSRDQQTAQALRSPRSQGAGPTPMQRGQGLLSQDGARWSSKEQ